MAEHLIKCRRNKKQSFWDDAVGPDQDRLREAAVTERETKPHSACTSTKEPTARRPDSARLLGAGLCVDGTVTSKTRGEGGSGTPAALYDVSLRSHF